MSRMELNIKGNPGSGNHYDDVHIDNVDNYTPNARTVVNNQGTTVNINLNVFINIDGQKVFNLFKNARLFMLLYFILFREAFRTIYSQCHSSFVQNARLGKAMAEVLQIWCKNAMGFIAHRSLLHCSSQPVAWAVAGGFIKPCSIIVGMLKQ